MKKSVLFILFMGLVLMIFHLTTPASLTFTRSRAALYERHDKKGDSYTAGMNRFCGDPSYTCGDDPRVVYLLAALSGAAFMQLPGVGSYLRPTDVEKRPIIERLRKEGLEGSNGMTLTIAGGLEPKNTGCNIKALGTGGRMFLAGTSVFHHPDGIKAGVDALKIAVEASHKGIVEKNKLKKYAQSIGQRGSPLLKVL